MKTCSQCAEEIQDAALVCKHCKSAINNPSVSGKKSKGRGLVNFLIGFCILSIAGLIIISLFNADPNKLAHKYGDPIDRRLSK